jgi:hypothetical protein
MTDKGKSLPNLTEPAETTELGADIKALIVLVGPDRKDI